MVDANISTDFKGTWSKKSELLSTLWLTWRLWLNTYHSILINWCSFNLVDLCFIGVRFQWYFFSLLDWGPNGTDFTVFTSSLIRFNEYLILAFWLLLSRLKFGFNDSKYMYSYQSRLVFVNQLFLDIFALQLGSVRLNTTPAFSPTKTSSIFITNFLSTLNWEVYFFVWNNNKNLLNKFFYLDFRHDLWCQIEA